ncbi:MAG TPA: tetratricopeptide repeat protein [Burkholderiaceae bacterium]|jgi:Flp pilus assembly protein TadD|nr:tetratricopeptide repeat protein [Burkholderiaceae bacterium]
MRFKQILAALCFATLPAGALMAQNIPVKTAESGAPVTSLDPGMDVAERQLAERDYAAALASYERVLAANPRNVQARFQRGVALNSLNRTDEAAAAFESLTQDFPDLPEPYNNLAMIRVKGGDLAGAQQALQMAVRLRPDFAVANGNLATVHLLQARRALEQVTRVSPGNAGAAQRLRALNELLGTEAP